MSEPSPADTVLDVTVVESPGCHFCEDAHRVLADAAERYPLRVRTEDVATAEGRRLMTAHRVGMSPLVLVDGAFFSSGRLPRRKLNKLLTARFGQPADASTVVG